MISMLFAFVSLLDRIPVPADIADSVICSDEQVADSCDAVPSGVFNCMWLLRRVANKKGLTEESTIVHESDGFYRIRFCRVRYTSKTEWQENMKKLALHFEEIYKEVNEKPRR